MKTIDSLVESLCKLAHVSDAEIKLLTSKLHYCECKKDDFLLHDGEVENFVYYIVDGIVRNYCLKDGNEISLDFFFPGDFTNAYMSFLTRQKSVVTVQALVDTKALRVHYNDLQLLYESSLSFNKVGRIISEQLYIKRTMRELSFITMSAAERYEDLMRRHPELIQHIQQKYLSTFLGVSPETLSRLRNNRRPVLN